MSNPKDTLSETGEANSGRNATAADGSDGNDKFDSTRQFLFSMKNARYKKIMYQHFRILGNQKTRDRVREANLGRQILEVFKGMTGMKTNPFMGMYEADVDRKDHLTIEQMLLNDKKDGNHGLVVSTTSEGKENNPTFFKLDRMGKRVVLTDNEALEHILRDISRRAETAHIWLGNGEIIIDQANHDVSLNESESTVLKQQRRVMEHSMNESEPLHPRPLIQKTYRNKETSILDCKQNTYDVLVPDGIDVNDSSICTTLNSRRKVRGKWDEKDFFLCMENPRYKEVFSKHFMQIKDAASFKDKRDVVRSIKNALLKELRMTRGKFLTFDRRKRELVELDSKDIFQKICIDVDRIHSYQNKLSSSSSMTSTIARNPPWIPSARYKTNDFSRFTTQPHQKLTPQNKSHKENFADIRKRAQLPQCSDESGKYQTDTIISIYEKKSFKRVKRSRETKKIIAIENSSKARPRKQNDDISLMVSQCIEAKTSMRPIQTTQKQLKKSCSKSKISPLTDRLPQFKKLLITPSTHIETVSQLVQIVQLATYKLNELYATARRHCKVLRLHNIPEFVENSSDVVSKAPTLTALASYMSVSKSDIRKWYDMCRSAQSIGFDFEIHGEDKIEDHHAVFFPIKTLHKTNSFSFRSVKTLNQLVENVNLAKSALKSLYITDKSSSHNLTLSTILGEVKETGLQSKKLTFLQKKLAASMKISLTSLKKFYFMYQRGVKSGLDFTKFGNDSISDHKGVFFLNGDDVDATKISCFDLSQSGVKAIEKFFDRIVTSAMKNPDSCVETNTALNTVEESVHNPDLYDENIEINVKENKLFGEKCAGEEEYLAQSNGSKNGNIIANAELFHRGVPQSLAIFQRNDGDMAVLKVVSLEDEIKLASFVGDKNEDDTSQTKTDVKVHGTNMKVLTNASGEQKNEINLNAVCSSIVKIISDDTSNDFCQAANLADSNQNILVNFPQNPSNDELELEGHHPESGANWAFSSLVQEACTEGNHDLSKCDAQKSHSFINSLYKCSSWNPEKNHNSQFSFVSTEMQRNVPDEADQSIRNDDDLNCPCKKLKSHSANERMNILLSTPSPFPELKNQHHPKLSTHQDSKSRHINAFEQKLGRLSFSPLELKHSTLSMEDDHSDHEFLCSIFDEKGLLFGEVGTNDDSQARDCRVLSDVSDKIINQEEPEKVYDKVKMFSFTKCYSPDSLESESSFDGFQVCATGKEVSDSTDFQVIENKPNNSEGIWSNWNASLKGISNSSMSATNSCTAEQSEHKVSSTSRLEHNNAALYISPKMSTIFVNQCRIAPSCVTISPISFEHLKQREKSCKNGQHLNTRLEIKSSESVSDHSLKRSHDAVHTLPQRQFTEIADNTDRKSSIVQNSRNATNRKLTKILYEAKQSGNPVKLKPCNKRFDLSSKVTRSDMAPFSTHSSYDSSEKNTDEQLLKFKCEALKGGTGRPKRKLKKNTRYDLLKGDSHARICKIGQGFICPRCLCVCYDDSTVCTSCEMECYNEAGVGVEMESRNASTPPKKNSSKSKPSKSTVQRSKGVLCNCSYCDKRKLSVQGLYAHYGRSHQSLGKFDWGKITFCCPFCESFEVFKTVVEIDEHVDTFHPDYILLKPMTLCNVGVIPQSHSITKENCFPAISTKIALDMTQEKASWMKLDYRQLIPDSKKKSPQKLLSTINHVKKQCIHLDKVVKILREQRHNVCKTEFDVDIRQGFDERSAYQKGIRERSRLSDAERIEKQKFSETQRLLMIQYEYENRNKRQNKEDIEVKKLCSQPIIFSSRRGRHHPCSQDVCKNKNCQLCKMDDVCLSRKILNNEKSIGKTKLHWIKFSQPPHLVLSPSFQETSEEYFLEVEDSYEATTKGATVTGRKGCQIKQSRLDASMSSQLQMEEEKLSALRNHQYNLEFVQKYNEGLIKNAWNQLCVKRRKLY